MDFEQIVQEEWKRVPERFAAKIENVALLIEDEPDERTREEEGLGEGQTLLGRYHGIPLVERGEFYGTTGTLPDTITLYRLPIIEEAELHGGTPEALREVIRETIWHEIGHYFGHGEDAIRGREEEGTNQYPE